MTGQTTNFDSFLCSQHAVYVYRYALHGRLAVVQVANEEEGRVAATILMNLAEPVIALRCGACIPCSIEASSIISSCFCFHHVLICVVCL